jgi:crossover junction endodeoxyribonuclease RuvC
LGIDPGSRLTGYGILDLCGNQIRHVAHGTLRLSNTGGKAVIPLEERLFLIYQGLTDIIVAHRPQVMSVEKVFFAKNAVSALKLGQARGATILTGRIHGLELAEYSPSEVKQSVAGYGQADKHQVAKMIRMLTGVRDFETLDASDGLALAVCHAHRVRFSASTSIPAAAPRKRKRVSLAESLGLESSGRALKNRDMKNKP